MNECTDELMDYDNKTWECYLCGKDDDWESFPFGYINNMHPLCEKCANEVFIDTEHRHHHRLTYHKDIGDITLTPD
jgi:hypothetical protein